MLAVAVKGYDSPVCSDAWVVAPSGTVVRAQVPGRATLAPLERRHAEVRALPKGGTAAVSGPARRRHWPADLAARCPVRL